MRRFTVTASTLGQANPSQVGGGRRYLYRYREFCAHREAGDAAEEAARLLGIRPEMAGEYENRRLAALEAAP